MSKIAILTLPFNNNYGGLLQSYALQFFLSKRGHDVTVINISVQIPDKSIIGLSKRIIKFLIGIEFRNNKMVKAQSKNMHQFINDNFQLTHIIKNKKDFFALNNLDFDTYIVGSDQVWRFDYTKSRYLNYFLDFVTNTNIKKVAFAASFGIDQWKKNKNDTSKISSLLKKFHSVSVREKSGIELCKKYLNSTPVHLLDPVFLLSPNDFCTSIINPQIKQVKKNKSCLLVYLLDCSEDKLKTVEVIAEKLNLKPIIAGKDICNPNSSQPGVYPPVSEWIDGFQNAEFVLTDSFHGCVFSILFNKQFIAYGNNERGITRFNSLFETFQIESRLIMHSSELIDQVIDQKINFQIINKAIEKNKLESIFFLENAGL